MWEVGLNRVRSSWCGGSWGSSCIGYSKGVLMELVFWFGGLSRDLSGVNCWIWIGVGINKVVLWGRRMVLMCGWVFVCKWKDSLGNGCGLKIVLKELDLCLISGLLYWMRIWMVRCWGR